jgi:Homeodomain-like domain
MLAWESLVEAQALRRQGWSVSAIARHLGVTRLTVRRYLNGERVPGQRARTVVDPFDEFGEYCRLRLAGDPHVWATTLFDEVVELGYAGSYQSFTRAIRTRGLRPRCEACTAAKSKDRAVIEHPPGEETLCGTPHKPSYAAPGNMRRPRRSDDDGPWFSGTCGLIVSA